MNIEPKIVYIDVENIIPNRFQPRLTFDETALSELANSIKEHGIIQPLVVRRLLNGKYEIIAGERRYKASNLVGLSKLPCIISELDDNASAEVALVENIQRKNLSAIEEAKSYKKLLDRGYLTQEQLAKRLGVSQSGVANKVRLLNLTDEVQDALMNELISERHARSLLQISNPKEQIDMLNNIIKNRMTVRQLDIEIKSKFDSTINPNNNDIETLDLNNINQIEKLTSLINDTKDSLDKEYEKFNIPTAEEVNEPNIKKETIKIEAGNLPSFVNKLKEFIKESKDKGFDIESEEYDFEDLYQIIIKVEK